MNNEHNIHNILLESMPREKEKKKERKGKNKKCKEFIVEIKEDR